VAAVLGVGLTAGCGLISSDVTDFDLALPEKKFTVDADGWQVNTAQASLFNPDGRLAAVQCSSMPTLCSSAVTQACPMGCTGSCNMTANSCELSLDISLAQPVNLLMEKPELKSINDQPVIKVAIDSVTYEVTSNSLNVATPDIKVYIAPTSVLKLKPNTDDATLIGTIPAVGAGATTSGEQMIQFTPTGKAALANIMSTFKVPFNVVVGSSLLVTAGQALPTGKLEAAVHIRGHAGL
jgi:hypothetical protein